MTTNHRIWAAVGSLLALSTLAFLAVLVFAQIIPGHVGEGVRSEPAQALSTPFVLDCTGVAVIAPTTLPLACADRGESLIDVSWEHWGPTDAAGQGVLQVHECIPTCAASTSWQSYPVTIAISGQVSKGPIEAFSEMTLSFPDTAPFFAEDGHVHVPLVTDGLEGNDAS